MGDGMVIAGLIGVLLIVLLVVLIDRLVHH